MKTAVELTCGTIRGTVITNPVMCLGVTRAILLEHERREQRAYRIYTTFAYGALVPAALGLACAAMALSDARRKRRVSAPSP